MKLGGWQQLAYMFHFLLCKLFCSKIGWKLVMVSLSDSDCDWLWLSNQNKYVCIKQRCYYHIISNAISLISLISNRNNCILTMVFKGISIIGRQVKPIGDKPCQQIQSRESSMHLHWQNWFRMIFGSRKNLSTLVHTNGHQSMFYLPNWLI